MYLLMYKLFRLGRWKFATDRKKVSLILHSLEAGYEYELNLRDIRSAVGDSLGNKLIDNQQKTPLS